MIVRELMTEAPATCRSEDSLNRAAQLMWELSCGSVPVVDDAGKVVGMVTDRDICVAAYTQGQSLPDIAVSTVTAGRPVISCPDSSDIKVAEALMTQHQVRRLAITDDADKLVGMLSLGDLAKGSVSKGKKKWITPARVGALTAAVSANGTDPAAD